MAKNNGGGVVIIKKVKKGGHGAHHGGAWKVAYADFVTAMMAFFLLLWLLNVTTDVQKRGIADYFDPSLASRSTSGAGGVLGGTAIGLPGSQKQSLVQPSFDVSHGSPAQIDESDDDNDNTPAGDENGKGYSGTKDRAQKLTVDELKEQIAEQEQKNFQEAKSALEQAVREVPELRALANNLMIDETSEGMRIQIVDQDKTPMYPLGSADMLESSKKLVNLVAQVVAKLPNRISITGHTDSTQYALSAKYTNWELSADRANASRREFIADGMPPSRIERVVGVADQDPLDKNDTAAPHNRRISIVLLRDAKDASPAPASAAKQ